MASTTQPFSAISTRAFDALPSSCLLTINDRQQWPLSNDADITRDHSNPAEFPPGCNSPAFGGNLRDRALNGALPVFHSASFDRANGPRLQPLAHHDLVHGSVNALHFQNVLSSSPSCDGSKLSRGLLTNGQKTPAGSSKYD